MGMDMGIGMMLGNQNAGAGGPSSLPGFMTSGAWWDYTNLTNPNAWVDRVGGLTLAPIGGRTTTIEAAAINGNPAMAFDQIWNGAANNSVLNVAASPMGVNPTSFSYWCLFKCTEINGAGGEGDCYMAYAGPGTISGLGETFLSISDPSITSGTAPPTATSQFQAETEDLNGADYWITNPDGVSATPTGWNLLEVVVNSVTYAPQYYINGAFVSLDPANTALPISTLDFTNLCLGTYLCLINPDEQDQANFVGDIAHTACTPFALSIANRQAIYNWLSNSLNYGISLPTANGCPIYGGDAGSLATWSYAAADFGVLHNGRGTGQGGNVYIEDGSPSACISISAPNSGLTEGLFIAQIAASPGLIEIDFHGNDINTIDDGLQNCESTSITLIDFSNNGLEASIVDQLLNDLAASTSGTTSGAVGTINLGGTNASPTSGSAAAIVTLMANGWTVNTS